MKKIGALIIKFILTTIAAWFSFGFIGGNPIKWIFVVSLAVTVLNFILGDLVILPNLGNIIAAAGDGLIAAIATFVLDLFIPDFCTTLITLPFFALTIAIIEYFFHIYLLQSKTICSKYIQNLIHAELGS